MSLDNNGLSAVWPRPPDCVHRVCTVQEVSTKQQRRDANRISEIVWPDLVERASRTRSGHTAEVGSALKRLVGADSGSLSGPRAPALTSGGCSPAVVGSAGLAFCGIGNVVLTTRVDHVESVRSVVRLAILVFVDRYFECVPAHYMGISEGGRIQFVDIPVALRRGFP